MFKVEFEKTYDMVNWRFIDWVKDQMGFQAYGGNG